MSRLIDADKLKEKIIWLPSVNGIPATVNHNRPLIDIAQACTEIDSAPTVAEWVPASERLPEHNTDVLCTEAKDKWVSMGHYDAVVREWYDVRDDDCTIRVTHWMPLPTPYERSEDIERD